MVQDRVEDNRTGKTIHVTGIVQGVGFRPFVYNLARRLALHGHVRNTGAGVEIFLLGNAASIDRFLHELRSHPPPLAQIDTISEMAFTPQQPDVENPTGFTILPSSDTRSQGQSATDSRQFVPVSPDVALCRDCRAELLDPADRRFYYPFINCTNCGPRYTIVLDVPYDRPATTMAGFALCDACRIEYEDPVDRRFHAQPNACPACGPRLWFVHSNGTTHTGNSAALAAAQTALAQGEIVAIKGIGGFHLACAATNAQAVTKLRERKGRPHKPFALMAASMKVARQFVEISPAAQLALESTAAPIVLLPKTLDCPLPQIVAPDNHRLGVILPYSPLHLLLFRPHAGGALPSQILVMTSGNLSEEPIATTNEEAQARLGRLADAFLLHDRPIHIACDDSVMAFADPTRQQSNAPGPEEPSSHPIFIRRSRGYAPTPIPLPFALKPVLATGGELKNTLCVAREQRAFLSGHIGDLANLETLHAFEQSVDHIQRLFRIEPQAVACDLHPGYLGTKWAQEHARSTGIPLIQVQHHHAHVAALMAEHQLSQDAEIIGVALDGTGYGPDNTIWGGEFMAAGYTGYRRLVRLHPVPLPGGDASIHRPYRMALAALWYFGLEWDSRLPPVAACPPAELNLLRRQLARDFNCIPTSSMGRFFDAVAALLGVCTTASYEAQGAIALEALAHNAAQAIGRGADVEPYPFSVQSTHAADLGQSAHDQVKFEVDIEPTFRALKDAVLATTTGLDRAAQGTMALRTHATVAAMVEAGCIQARRCSGINRVGLTGGVFQNALLLTMTRRRLARTGFETLVHRLVPPNDGGLALGQAVIAGLKIGERSRK